MDAPDCKEKILVVDDTADTLEIVQRNLLSCGYAAYTASNAMDAIQMLDAVPIDLVITDIKMPKFSGIDLVRHIRENHRNTEVMIITGYPTIEGAVEAIKTGAEEYLAKPFTDTELIAAVRRVLERLNQRRLAAPSLQRKPIDTFGLIGESSVMKKVFSAIARAAASPATVLIIGESGSGKELVARAIHYNSPKAAAPFVPVNCGGIPETLLESGLFGHVRGAFTGANESRAGFFQTADGGTIFLDEISETSMNMQVKLLRVLQEKEVCMVGDSRPRKVNVRVVAATNKNLQSLIQSGAFREELFYRLNVVTLEIPPLRDREKDILLLAQHFVRKFALELGRSVPKFSPKALQVLLKYPWPGNVRELENAVQRIIVMSDADIIEVPDLPVQTRFSALRTARLDRSLSEVESEHIRNVLVKERGNKSRASEILGIDRKTLREKMRKYHIQ
jgi:two-component system response regulator HydG